MDILGVEGEVVQDLLGGLSESQVKIPIGEGFQRPGGVVHARDPSPDELRRVDVESDDLPFSRGPLLEL